MGAVVALWVLATWCAEVAWGGFTVADYPVVLVVLGPLYGSAALLIREVARRRGAGWPGVVLLAAAFGLVQAGLVDQSLFDREALADTEFAQANELAAATVVPGLGFSAEQLFDFVGGHVWLSVCAPIALVEACVARERRRVPWLGRRGIVVSVVLYLGASALIWSDSGRSALPVQFGFVLPMAGGLAAAAMVPREKRAERSGGSPLLVGGVVLAAHAVSWFFGSSWLGVGLRVVTLVVVVVLVLRWVGDGRHVVAAWGAGVLAAAVAAFLSPPYAAAEPWLMLTSDIVGAVIAVGVVGLAYRRESVGASLYCARHGDS
ncbi:hypothetical protein AB0M02_21895 [Actinoplanes sp. NPDC051861]|uniref:hypothetical protein n=1 Tax=Actinoplanes sp. NPDC051861 TaxID=3155170 RepID=UPI003413E29F